ncbi:MAG: succinylglutamate desuccinylase/aspartoacylase family protein [Candidatus Thorarchaeota archaeon]
MKEITIGSAKSEPGKINYGFIDALDLPTGSPERIPVIIAQGTENGPTMFFTANIHGNELTGIDVIHEVVTEELVKQLKGTIVAIPTLNPSGLRAGKRSPEFSNDDPNRTFPEGMFAKDDEESKHPKPFEQIANCIYSYFEKYADFHLDFHNHSIRSVPYSILDRIFYTDDTEKAEAEILRDKQKEMAESFGIMITADFPAKKYLKLKYHRSTSGAVLNSLRIPAFTVELGANTILVPEVVAGSVKATMNLLRWAEMLDGEIEEITEFEVPKPKERLQRIEHPRSGHSGVIKFLVSPGEKVTKGQPIAKITDIFGRPLGDGYIRTEYDGYMIALYSMMAVYPHGAISEMGIKDNEPLLVKMPMKRG